MLGCYPLPCFIHRAWKSFWVKTMTSLPWLAVLQHSTDMSAWGGMPVLNTQKDQFGLTHFSWCHCFQPTDFKQSYIKPLFYRYINYISNELRNKSGLEWCRGRFQFINLCTPVVPSGSFINEQENRAGI